MSQVVAIRNEIRESFQDSPYQIIEENASNLDMSFDFLARTRKSNKYSPDLVIKILLNIDNIKPHYINEIKLISDLIAGIPIFIGYENRHSVLREDSIYFRDNIISINLPTFRKLIEHPEIAFALAFAKRGGFFHEIDGKKLYELRKKHGLSRSALAEKVDVSAKSISHYERKGMRASIEHSNDLGRVLGDSVIKSIKFFEYIQDNLENFRLDPSLQRKITSKTKEFMKKIDEIIELTGYQSFWPKSAPFDLCIYKQEDQTDQIKEYTLIGGTECEPLCAQKEQNTKKHLQKEFFFKIPRDRDCAIIYDEEIYNKQLVKQQRLPYLVPKELKKLENPKEFKKMIKKRRIF